MSVILLGDNRKWIKKIGNKLEESEEIETSRIRDKYVLCLFVAGINPKFKNVIENLSDVCSEFYR